MHHRFFALLIPFSLAAMEPVIIQMEEEGPDERTKLLPPQQIAMSEQNKIRNSIIYNGSARFFDEESRKKVRNEAFKKQCIVPTLLASIFGGCAGSSLMLSCVACWYPCCGAQGACFCYQAGGLFFESAVCGLGTCCCVSALSTGFVLGMELLKKMKEENSLEQKLEIPQEMLETADAKKTYWLKKELLQTFVNSTAIKNDCILPNVIHFLTCAYKREKRILVTLEERLQQKSYIRPFLADKFNREYKLPKDVIKHLFAFVDCNLSDQFSYITERELFYMLRNLRYNTSLPSLVLTYYYQILLAKNGWISFCKTEKYPIRCETKYFDSGKRVFKYYAIEGPTIYLPFSLELARYYKFEEDPAYEAEYSHSSNEQIYALLAEREKICLNEKKVALIVWENSNWNDFHQ